MNKTDELDFHIISSNESHLIKLVASWYEEQWSIPEAKVSEMISHLDDELFHGLLAINGEPVATGGIHRKVSVFAIDATLAVYDYWLALVYVRPEFRGKGIGAILCAQLEQEALKRKIEKLHLFTHTAESFYRNQHWQLTKRIFYQDRDIAVMEKKIDRQQDQGALVDENHTSVDVCSVQQQSHVK
ncbi:GNAT family N-acetyltransferase [Pedobacter chitinilyticus]|uniref:GNAT family N-acetyltransferase n=1 Tax=Pedobacter chitinilyticus TaxID=2233776 RepID=A0A3S4RS97_9SPHI|nr:GNAT family N-acetyltransferase [Pedobacter chitinilyticus]RWU09890.1 GNAT family N-acetyltransferase [Pedobacter chitinilyticus]